MKRSHTPPQRSLRVSDTANSVLQNRINISIIFNYLRDHGVSYRARIARDLGISAPAVARAIGRLLNDAYVTESERVQVENGRKAAQVSVNAGRGYIIGADLLSDPVRFAISDFSGTLHATFSAQPMVNSVDYLDHLIESVDAGWSNFLNEFPDKDARILALGVGVPAVVNPQTGTILYANLYERLLRSDFYAKISGHYEFPVFIENTSNLSAIAEWKRGAGRGMRNLVFIELGNGIGAGIILEGDLYHGAQGAAGEIGYFLTGPDGLGYDGKKVGYLESKASLLSMHRSGSHFRGDPVHFNQALPDLFRLATSGDGTALGIIGDAVRHLTVSIVNIMLLLNPDTVIIGGAACGLPGADALILNPLIEEVRRIYPFAPAAIRLGDLGADAGLIGAVQFALDSLVVHAYPYRL